MEATQRLYDQSEDEEEEANSSFRKKLFGKFVFLKSAEGEKEEVFDVYGGENRIGRDHEQSSIVLNTMSLSRVHAVIEVSPNGSVDLYDDHSMNGTYKNSRKLKPGVRYALEGGEDLILGDIKAKYLSLDKTQTTPEKAAKDDVACFVPETPVTLIKTHGRLFNPEAASSPLLPAAMRGVMDSPTSTDISTNDKTADDSSFIAPSQPMFTRPFNVDKKSAIESTSGSKFGESTLDFLNMDTQKADDDLTVSAAAKEKEQLMLMETQQFDATDVADKTDVDKSSLSQTVKRGADDTDASKIMLIETQDFSDESKTSETTVRQRQQPSDDEISKMMLMETQDFNESDMTNKVATSDIMSMETQCFESKIEVEKSKNGGKDSSAIFDVETQPFEAAPDQEMKEVEEEVILPVKAYKLGEEDSDEESENDEANLPEMTADFETTAVRATEKSVNICEAETQLLDASCLSPKSVNPEPDLLTNPEPDTSANLELDLPANPEAEKSESHHGDETRSNASEDLLAEVSQESFDEAAEIEEQQDSENENAEKIDEEQNDADKESAENKVTEHDEYEEQYMGATQLFDTNDSENLVEDKNENDEDKSDEEQEEEPVVKVHDNPDKICESSSDSDDFIPSSQVSMPDRTNFTCKSMSLTMIPELSTQLNDTDEPTLTQTQDPGFTQTDEIPIGVIEDISFSKAVDNAATEKEPLTGTDIEKETCNDDTEHAASVADDNKAVSENVQEVVEKDIETNEEAVSITIKDVDNKKEAASNDIIEIKDKAIDNVAASNDIIENKETVDDVIDNDEACTVEESLLEEDKSALEENEAVPNVVIENQAVDDNVGACSVEESAVEEQEPSVAVQHLESTPIRSDPKQDEKTPRMKVLRLSKSASISSHLLETDLEPIPSPVLSHGAEVEEHEEQEDSENLLSSTQVLLGNSPEPASATSPILEPPVKAEEEEVSPVKSPSKRARARRTMVPDVNKSEVDESLVRRSGRATRPSTKFSNEDFVSDPFIHDAPISPSKKRRKSHSKSDLNDSAKIDDSTTTAEKEEKESKESLPKFDITEETKVISPVKSVKSLPKGKQASAQHKAPAKSGKRSKLDNSELESSVHLLDDSKHLTSNEAEHHHVEDVIATDDVQPKHDVQCLKTSQLSRKGKKDEKEQAYETKSTSKSSEDLEKPRIPDVENEHNGLSTAEVVAPEVGKSSRRSKKPEAELTISRDSSPTKRGRGKAAASTPAPAEQLDKLSVIAAEHDGTPVELDEDVALNADRRKRASGKAASRAVNDLAKGKRGKMSVAEPVATATSAAEPAATSKATRGQQQNVSSDASKIEEMETNGRKRGLQSIHGEETAVAKTEPAAVSGGRRGKKSAAAIEEAKHEVTVSPVGRRGRQLAPANEEAKLDSLPLGVDKEEQTPVASPVKRGRKQAAKTEITESTFESTKAPVGRRGRQSAPVKPDIEGDDSESAPLATTRRARSSSGAANASEEIVEAVKPAATGRRSKPVAKAVEETAKAKSARKGRVGRGSSEPVELLQAESTKSAIHSRRSARRGGSADPEILAPISEPISKHEPVASTSKSAKRKGPSNEVFELVPSKKEKSETDEKTKVAGSSLLIDDDEQEPISLTVLTSRAPVTYSRKRKTETCLSIVTEVDEDDPIFHKSPPKKVKPESSPKSPTRRGGGRSSNTIVKPEENIVRDVPAPRGRGRGSVCATRAKSVEPEVSLKPVAPPRSRGRGKAGTTEKQLVKPEEAKEPEITAPRGRVCTSEPITKAKTAEPKEPEVAAPKSRASAPDTKTLEVIDPAAASLRGRGRASGLVKEKTAQPEETHELEVSVAAPRGRGRVSAAKTESVKPDVRVKEVAAPRGRGRASQNVTEEESEVADEPKVSAPRGRGRASGHAAKKESIRPEETAEQEMTTPRGKGHTSATVTKKKAVNPEEFTIADEPKLATPRGRGRASARVTKEDSSQMAESTSNDLNQSSSSSARGKRKTASENIEVLASPSQQQQKGRKGRGSNVKVGAEQDEVVPAKVPRRSAASKKAEETNQDETLSNSKRESSSSHKLKPVVMFTGYEDKQHEKIVKDLGGKLTSNPNDCTVLVTDKVRRTAKFLCTIGKGIPIVSHLWLLSSKQARVFQNPLEHLLEDDESEKKWGFRLNTSITQAADKPLLSGYKVSATKKVVPPPDQLRDMVECAGGTWLKALPRKSEENLFVISCPEDQTEQNKLAKLGIKIVDKEILLTGLLKQMLDFKAFTIQN